MHRDGCVIHNWHSRSTRSGRRMRVPHDGSGTDGHGSRQRSRSRPDGLPPTACHFHPHVGLRRRRRHCCPVQQAAGLLRPPALLPRQEAQQNSLGWGSHLQAVSSARPPLLLPPLPCARGAAARRRALQQEPAAVAVHVCGRSHLRQLFPWPPLRARLPRPPLHPPLRSSLLAARRYICIGPCTCSARCSGGCRPCSCTCHAHSCQGCTCKPLQRPDWHRRRCPLLLLRFPLRCRCWRHQRRHPCGLVYCQLPDDRAAGALRGLRQTAQMPWLRTASNFPARQPRQRPAGVLPTRLPLQVAWHVLALALLGPLQTALLLPLLPSTVKLPPQPATRPLLLLLLLRPLQGPALVRALLRWHAGRPAAPAP